ncbi:hypothetical protein SDC9_34655 [bioreactor metagenome]|uniref:Uncharacterized protein n=1 Tax=bioreactor metagenome TaxID=1076179 RepID=A0A644VB94_9ZZZZ
MSTKPPAYLFRYLSISKSRGKKQPSAPILALPADQPRSLPASIRFRFGAFSDRRGVFRFGEGGSTAARRPPQADFSQNCHFFRVALISLSIFWASCASHGQPAHGMRDLSTECRPPSPSDPPESGQIRVGRGAESSLSGDATPCPRCRNEKSRAQGPATPSIESRLSAKPVRAPSTPPAAASRHRSDRRSPSAARTG